MFFPYHKAAIRLNNHSSNSHGSDSNEETHLIKHNSQINWIGSSQQFALTESLITQVSRSGFCIDEMEHHGSESECCPPLVDHCNASKQYEVILKVDTQKKPSQGKSEVDATQAWLTLACVFLINATTLGSLKVYGLVFEEIVSQKYYNREEASWPISTASTIQNLAGLLTPMLSLKISWRSIEIIQTALFAGANIGAYFSNSLTQDIFFLGIVQGIALSLRYNMNIVINNEYFSKYRATAMGVSLAGSTCGVFALKPIISYVLDSSDKNFRYAYLTLAAIMLLNLILNFFIRKPRSSIRPDTPDSQGTEHSFGLNQDDDYNEDGEFALKKTLLGLLKNPNIHCVWILQTLYFYISRTYTIFVVDYGVDRGFSRDDSRDFLNFWVYGEIGGRLLLGSFVDSRKIPLKWNLVLVNLLLSSSGFVPLLAPEILNRIIGTNTVDDRHLVYLFWTFGVSFSLVAALSSLVNMMIVPFGQEYLGKKNVPWAFAIGSVVTSFFLLFRPSIIGLSRDYYKSYSLLIAIMSTGPLLFAILFAILEPLLLKFRFNAPERARGRDDLSSQ